MFDPRRDLIALLYRILLWRIDRQWRALPPPQEVCNEVTHGSSPPASS